MLIILSPAKTQDFQSTVNTESYSVPYFAARAQELVKYLQKLSKADLSKLMGVSAKIAELNFKRYKYFEKEFTKDNARQALLAYKGDVYREVKAYEFTQDDFSFAQKHLRLISGLYGSLRPLDLIQPYRLEMDVDLATGRGENIYEFWGDSITERINAELKDQSCEYVINLASNEYYAAVKPEKIEGRIIKITFLENRNGALKIIGILAKKARGMMVNFIIKNRITVPEEIKKFDYSGYKFDGDLSSESEFVFVR